MGKGHRHHRKHDKLVRIHQPLLDAYEQYENIYRMNMPTTVYGCYGDCGSKICEGCCASRKPTRKEIEQARAGHTICAKKPRAFPFYTPYNPLNPGFTQAVEAYPILCPGQSMAMVNGQAQVCNDKRWCCVPPPVLVQGRNCAAPSLIQYGCTNCNVGNAYVNPYGFPTL